MTQSRIDQSELLTVLHSGEGPLPFSTFLERFRRRAGALEAVLFERRSRGAWLLRHSVAAGTERIPHPDRKTLLGLRPGRVYPFDEIDPESSAAGRIIRSTSPSGDQWLMAVGSRRGFNAADSALLSSLAPHIAIACENRARLDELFVERAAAEAALARSCVGWALLDGGGERVAGGVVPGSRRNRAALIDAVARGSENAVAGELLGTRSPAVGEEAPAGALALFRIAAAPRDRAHVFAAAYGVPPSEARLAVALAEGASLTDAAAHLGITVKTARFYSKRLYAATGTKGQADLVRLVWTGLAALA